MNLKKLNDLIEASGYKKQFIAKSIGLSYQGFLYKTQGVNDFTAKELNNLSKILKMSKKQKIDIFFDN